MLMLYCWERCLDADITMLKDLGSSQKLYKQYQMTTRQTTGSGCLHWLRNSQQTYLFILPQVVSQLVAARFFQGCTSLSSFQFLGTCCFVLMCIPLLACRLSSFRGGTLAFLICFMISYVLTCSLFFYTLYLMLCALFGYILFLPFLPLRQSFSSTFHMSTVILDLFGVSVGLLLRHTSIKYLV